MKYAIFILILCGSIYGVKLYEKSLYQGQINDLKALADSRIAKQQELRGIIEGLYKDKTGIQEDLDQIRERRDFFEGEMLNLKNEVANAKQQLAVYKSETSDANQQLTQTAKSISMLQTGPTSPQNRTSGYVSPNGQPMSSTPSNQLPPMPPDVAQRINELAQESAAWKAQVQAFADRAGKQNIPVNTAPGRHDFSDDGSYQANIDAANAMAEALDAQIKSIQQQYAITH